MLRSAVAAWDWAQKNGAAEEHDAAVVGAIHLYRATGQKKYLDAFHAHTVFKRMKKPQLKEYQKYDQQDASFYYARCERSVDDAVRRKIIDAFKATASHWSGTDSLKLSQ